MKLTAAELSRLYKLIGEYLRARDKRDAFASGDLFGVSTTYQTHGFTIRNYELVVNPDVNNGLLRKHVIDIANSHLQMLAADIAEINGEDFLAELEPLPSMEDIKSLSDEEVDELDSRATAIKELEMIYELEDTSPTLGSSDSTS